MTPSTPETTPAEAVTQEYAHVLDVRPHAGSTPSVAHAVPTDATLLVSSPESLIDSLDDHVLIVCDIGVRSAVVTDALVRSGYRNTVSLAGGIERWRAEGLPLTSSSTDLTAEQHHRYDRQIKVPSVGANGQLRLGKAHVTIVGAGGLGVPVLSYLTAAGVGRITVIDADDVEISNLHRQPIYRTDDVGSMKAATAASYARRLNPDVTIDAAAVRLTTANAIELLSDCDVVVVCTDSFSTAHDINSAAVRLGIPLVFGSVYRTEGQLAVLDATRGPCYACVFPREASDADMSCAIVGVLGPVTGIVGSMQALDTIMLITDPDGADVNTLHIVDARNHIVDALTVRKNPSCAVCGP